MMEKDRRDSLVWLLHSDVNKLAFAKMGNKTPDYTLHSESSSRLPLECSKTIDLIAKMKLIDSTSLL